MLWRGERSETRKITVGRKRGGGTVVQCAMWSVMVVIYPPTIDHPASFFRAQGADRAHEHYAIDAAMPRLVRIAELALAAESREALRAALQADESLTTEVSEADIEQLRHNMWGRPPLADRLYARLVHVPAVYRQWARVNAWRRGLRGGSALRGPIRPKAPFHAGVACVFCRPCTRTDYNGWPSPGMFGRGR